MVKTADSPRNGGQLDQSPPKRKKIEDHETNGSKKKPRTRVSYSCGECHRRKQKCDRQVPCSHCVARKVPDLCKAYTPGKSDQDIHVRLARLEHIIDAALPQFAGMSLPGSPTVGPPISSSRQRSSSSTPDENGSQTEEPDLGVGTFQSGKWYGNSASGSIAPATVLEQLQHVRASTPPPDTDMNSPRVPPYLAESENPSIHGPNSQPEGLQPSVSLIDASEPSAADKLQSLVQDCGVSPSKLTELIHELPPPKVSDILVDYYFDKINWTRYPLSESEFRASYKSICSNGLNPNPNDMRFLPLLFVVLAISVRLAPDRIGGDPHNRRVSSLRYYWSSRRSLLIAAAIQPDSIEMVLVRLLSARFLTFDRRITECWSQLGAAVRTAQALGLHRDGTAMGMSPPVVEYRRRIWAYLYHADRSYALVLGRPNAIQDDYTSTPPPLNIEDASRLTSNKLHHAPPLSTPSRITFVILRHGLAAIIGRMVHHFQQVRSQSHYSEVIAIDDELQRFIDTLPPHFSMHPDNSLDHVETYIPVHRFLIITEIMFVRISLHRPYLLRRLGSDRYVRSRRACFTSAMQDFDVRQAFRKTMPQDTQESMSNAYREFQTAMISGIYLVLDPNGKDAEAMHAILDAFLKDHEGVQELDETTRRELKIIEFLKDKASRGKVRLGTETAAGSPMETMDAQANLLLSFQKSHKRGGSRPGDVSAAPSTPVHPTFAPLSIHTPPPVQMGTHALSPSSMNHKSPTFQRIQGESYAHLRHSPAGSGSPGVEDEPSTTAQSLLDHWYNSVSSGPQSDLLAGGGLGAPWGGYSGGGSDSGWLSAPFLFGGDGSVSVLEGSDHTYWENLVNQIRPPVS